MNDLNQTELGHMIKKKNIKHKLWHV